MRLTVLGASGTYPRPGGACNSYLVQASKDALLLDIGPGSLSNLFSSPGFDHVRTLILSHLHPDHLTDIFPFRYYLQFSAPADQLPVTVLCPPGTRQRVLEFSADSNVDEFDRVFDFVESHEQGVYEVGGLTVELLEVKHMRPTYSVRVRHGGHSLYYTSDTAWDDRIIEYAKGVDLFICEATLLHNQVSESIAHLSGRQAGTLAAKARVGKLVLTHLWAHHDSQAILEEARQAFNGPVELAAEGHEYQVGAE